VTIERLPDVPVAGHASSGLGGPAHPMRVATRRAAGLAGGGWTEALRGEVEAYFDGLAEDWHTRVSPQRRAVVADALERGVGALGTPRGRAVEVGSGIGTYSPLLVARFGRALAVDLSLAMLLHAPARPAQRLRADGAALPLADGSAAAVVLVNAFLFPGEVERVLRADGVVVWVNCSGAETPIHLPPEEVAGTLRGGWGGVAGRAGQGEWCVLRRLD